MSIQSAVVTQTRSVPDSFPPKPHRFERPRASPWKFWTEPGESASFVIHLIIFLVLLCAIPLWMFGAEREVAIIASCGTVGWYLFWTFLRWACD